MMFRLEWLLSATDDLAKEWIQASSAERSAITAASHAIDVELIVNPDE